MVSKMTNVLSNIVARAMRESVTDIGQLSEQERRELNRAVQRGVLAKAKGGPFPILKTVYAKPDFDFAAQRAAYIAQMEFAHRVDVAHDVAGYFPCVNWE
jgi:hypothetical protein